MNATLSIIFGWLLITTVVGVMAGLKRKFSMEEYFVAGRSFGLFLFYTTAAAEIYSAFAFLGLAGWAYKFGAPITYAFAYGTMAYALYFFLGPRINRLGKHFRYMSQPDFLEDRYGSKLLGLLVASIGVVFIIPYLQLQIMGAGMIVQLASGGAISWQKAVLVSFAAAVIFVYISGFRGIGWTNFLQAIIMLLGMVSVGVLFPSRFFGGVGEMFRELASASPEHLVLPGKTGNMGISWYASTALMCGLGFWMWPHIFMATFSARSEQVIRRNAVILPLYQLALVPVVIVGFTCYLAVKDVSNPDHAMLIALTRHFPWWIAGFIGAGGLAAAISTASALILCAATLIARNLYQRGLNPQASDASVAWLGRAMVPVVTAVAVLLAFKAPNMLVNLLLTGYAGVTQLFPAVLFGLFWPRVTRAGAIAGIASGIGAVALIHTYKLSVPLGMNMGFFALLVNLVVTVLVSLATSPDEERARRFLEVLSQRRG